MKFPVQEELLDYSSDSEEEKEKEICVSDVDQKEFNESKKHHLEVEVDKNEIEKLSCATVNK